jgi:hypothetical protein
MLGFWRSALKKVFDMPQGTCLCGAVRFEVQGPYKWFTYCHCSMCRKHHGTFHNLTAAAEKANFRFLQGEEAIVHFRSSPAFARPFCKHCGSKVPDASGEFVGFSTGSIEGEFDAKPRAHIFVADKSPLEKITDSLRQFETYPEGFGTAVAAPVNPDAHSEGIHGSCLCGSVAFVIDRTPKTVVQCHCSRCRRSRGTAHAVNTFVQQDAVRFTRGGDRVKAFVLPNARSFASAFCQDCGSTMPTLFAALNMYLVPVGSLDTHFEPKAFINIYTGSKAPWFSITNTYPQYEELPPRERLREIMFN